MLNRKNTSTRHLSLRSLEINGKTQFNKCYFCITRKNSRIRPGIIMHISQIIFILLVYILLTMAACTNAGNDFGAHFKLGNMHSKSASEELLQKFPNNFELYYFKGIQKINEKNIEGAILDFERARTLLKGTQQQIIKKQPADEQRDLNPFFETYEYYIWLTEIQVWQTQGRHQKVLNEFKFNTELMKNKRAGYYYLAQSHLSLNNVDAACKALYLAREYNYESSKELTNDIKKWAKTQIYFRPSSQIAEIRFRSVLKLEYNIDVEDLINKFCKPST